MSKRVSAASSEYSTIVTDDISQGKLKDGETVDQVEEEYKHLGTFRVEVWREIRSGRSKRGSFRNRNAKTSDPVPEKAVKKRAIDVGAE